MSLVATSSVIGVIAASSSVVSYSYHINLMGKVVSCLHLISCILSKALMAILWLQFLAETLQFEYATITQTMTETSHSHLQGKSFSMQAYLTHDLHFGQDKVYTRRREPILQLESSQVAYCALHIESGLRVHVRSTQ